MAHADDSAFKKLSYGLYSKTSLSVVSHIRRLNFNIVVSTSIVGSLLGPIE